MTAEQQYGSMTYHAAKQLDAASAEVREMHDELQYAGAEISQRGMVANQLHLELIRSEQLAHHSKEELRTLQNKENGIGPAPKRVCPSSPIIVRNDEPKCNLSSQPADWNMPEVNYQGITCTKGTAYMVPGTNEIVSPSQQTPFSYAPSQEKQET